MINGKFVVYSKGYALEKLDVDGRPEMGERLSSELMPICSDVITKNTEVYEGIFGAGIQEMRRIREQTYYCAEEMRRSIGADYVCVGRNQTINKDERITKVTSQMIVTFLREVPK